MSQEIIKKIIDKNPDYGEEGTDDEGSITWEVECPFCGKDNIAYDCGDVAVQIEECCVHFYHFDYFDDMFTFRVKEGE